MANYVLVHGSFQGGWIWKRAAEVLRKAGHTVYAPTLDGCAERSHLIRPGITIAAQAREVADMMFYEDLFDVALVATSTGGLVACKTAELARERISRLVFVDALAPQPGRTGVGDSPEGGGDASDADCGACSRADSGGAGKPPVRRSGRGDEGVGGGAGDDAPGRGVGRAGRAGWVLGRSAGGRG